MRTLGDGATIRGRMSGRLEGEVCIITGTGGSIGRQAALTFAREGASVVGCDTSVGPAEATVTAGSRRGGSDGLQAAVPSRRSGALPSGHRACTGDLRPH